ncbi:hypothetical protein JZ751_022930 [Albula glossodonta]|uniref:Uncharacterized protein n=1 Tax=Albula glossodonta TaxID=121402 RepID=A0A8T2PHL9_9TELE|nr:hypothetical protein JZ751_022930 [Albula glossodonta]
MESAQKNDAPPRIYEGLTSPESVYHSLHFQNPGGNKTALDSKAPKLPSVSKPGSELWHLQDNIFYLSWHGPGNCQSAEAFCRKRNATLAISYQHNRSEVLCSCMLFSAPEAAHCGAYHGWLCEKRAYRSQTDNDMFSE